MPNKICNEYNKAAMTAFPTLSNADIDNILAYTAAPAPPPPMEEGMLGRFQFGISNEIILVR